MHEDDFTPLTVYVPSPDCECVSVIEQGSGIVASPGNENLLIVDFQGRSQAENIITYGDRVHHAASRHLHGYPTTARRHLPLSSLTAVGIWNPILGAVHVHPTHETLLTRWLNVEYIQEEELLAGSGVFVKHRTLIKMMRSSDHQQRIMAQTYARSS